MRERLCIPHSFEMRYDIRIHVLFDPHRESPSVIIYCQSESSHKFDALLYLLTFGMSYSFILFKLYKLYKRDETKENCYFVV